MTTLIIIAIVVLALGCSVKIGVSSTEDEEKDPVPLCGLGGYVIPEGWGSVLPDTSGKIRARSMSYHGQQTRKTTALMKELEAELEERSDPTRKTIPWGEPSRKAITSRDKPLRSDEIYEEPQAAYPSFDTDDLPPAELFGSHEQALHAWVVNKGYWPYCTPISARKQQ